MYRVWQIALIIAGGMESASLGDGGTSCESKMQRNPDATASRAAGMLQLRLIPGSSSFGSTPSPPPKVFPTMSPTPVPSEPLPTPKVIPGRAIVHAFEYTFEEVRDACASFGAAGFSAVQISPPQDNICAPSWTEDQLDAYEHSPPHAWYCRYQPRSFNISACSTIGKCNYEWEFYEMAKECQQHGVHILVDLVVNHMMSGFRSFTRKGAAPGTDYSWNVPGAGSSPNPPTFKEQDFHTACSIEDGTDDMQVVNCDLLGLADLNTGHEHQRNAIILYMNRLLALGASAFRIDAAGHMAPDDTKYLADNANDVRSDFGGGRPYIFQEVLQSFKKHTYSNSNMQTTDPTPGHWIKDTFKNNLNLRALFDQFENKHGLVNSVNAVTFVDNHDSQRGHGDGVHVLTYGDGRLYELGQMFMLAYPYGTVKVMSSYRFGSSGAPRPSQSPDCADPNKDWRNASAAPWACEYRWRGIENAVGFRAECAEKSAWYVSARFETRGGRCFAFSRTHNAEGGFLAINLDSQPCSIPAKTQTGLRSGAYANLMTCDSVPCDQTVFVEPDETMRHNWILYKNEALMFHTGVRSD